MTTSSDPRRFASRCAQYRESGGLGPRWLPPAFPPEEIDRLDAIARRHPPLRKREALFRQGEPFTSLFLIRSGSLKQVTRMDNDEEQVTGFFLPTEMIGLDAIGERHYPGSALALETTTVWEFPFERLDDLTAQLSASRRRLYRTMSQEIHSERLMRSLMLHETADARLANFFLAMSARFRRLGYSPHVFRLAMSRGDIGNYLGLAGETVSRLLTRFKRQGLASAQGHEFRLLDPEALARLAKGCRDA